MRSVIDGGEWKEEKVDFASLFCLAQIKFQLR